MDPVLLKWILFNAGVVVMLALDLGVFHRKDHVITVREALMWTGIWIAAAAAYAVFIFFWRGEAVALEFVTGYLIEKSLSVDNIFVIVLIFSYFKVPPEYQHRVLFWGIIGALIMRGALIAVGAALIQEFNWIIYVFGGFLIFTGIRMAVQKEAHVEPDRSPIVRIFRRLMPVTPAYHGHDFFVRLNGRAAATPLFVALLVVEFTDLIFAVDSIPAIFAITTNTFIVYTSNVFAILGLRSLYFALAGIIHRFRYLKLGLSFVLVFVGIKMLLGHTAYKIPTAWSLAVIGGILAISIVASLLLVKPEEDKR